jgi:hypothetical protein
MGKITDTCWTTHCMIISVEYITEDFICEFSTEDYQYHWQI